MNVFYSPLTSEALLHISGPDALVFLQGQTTCDTRSLDTASALPGLYCTPQGRVVCDFLLCQLGEEHFALRMKRGITQGAATTFGKYIIFSKATIDSEQGDWQLFACWGPEAAALLSEIIGPLTTGPLGVTAQAGLRIIQMDSEGEQFECYVNTALHPQLPEQLSVKSQPAPEADWEALQIRRGWGRIESTTVEEFVPQMLNYDLTGHISFNKGCYTGQEVVARLHYRGTPKRRMYLAELPGGASAAAGDPLYTEGRDQSVGNVVNVSTTRGSGSPALVVATIELLDQGLHLDNPSGPLLTLSELPYALDSD